jgi:hypothetical protein
LGTVSAVHDYGAGASLEIVCESGPPLLVPFTRASVPEVDVRHGRVLVVVPEEVNTPTSWPGLVRPSTSSLVAPAQDVDGWAKPGHDGPR